MLNGISKIRNHVIARIFKELNLIEQWGSGVRRIFKEAASIGLPRPQITEIGMRVRITIFLAKAIALDSTLESNDRLELRLESRLESKIAAKMVLYLKDIEAGKVELSKALGHKTVSGELHKQIKSLLDANYVEMTIPEKPNSRLQKYRLTNDGRSLLINCR